MEDVISTIIEDVLAVSISDPNTAEASSGRLRRTLRSTKNSPMPRRRALRAHHLPHNHFKRPRTLTRRRLEENENTGAFALMDLIQVTGGYDGKQIFFQFDLDVSKQFVSSFDDLIQKPLELLSEIDFLKNILPAASGAGGGNSPVSIESNITLDGSAHVGVVGTCGRACCMGKSHCFSCTSCHSNFSFHMMQSGLR